MALYHYSIQRFLDQWFDKVGNKSGHQKDREQHTHTHAKQEGKKREDQSQQQSKIHTENLKNKDEKYFESILGLHPSSTSGDIKNLYSELDLQYHPVNGEWIYLTDGSTIHSCCYDQISSYIPNKENELYEWIRNNTNAEDVFVDTEPILPVLAQRRMYVAIDRRAQGRIVRSPGYSFLFMDFFRLICGYDNDLLAKRTNIVYTIYSSNRNLTSAQQADIFTAGKNAYVIVRKAAIRSNLNKRGFKKVFQSARSNFLVYRLTK